MTLIRRHPRLDSCFRPGAGADSVFCRKFVARAIYWSDPAHQNQQIEPWMTVGYIGRSWRLDPRAIDAEAGLPLPNGRPLTLEEIARQRGVPVSEHNRRCAGGDLRLMARKAAEGAIGE